MVLFSCGSEDTYETIQGSGTLRFNPIEGGCWYIEMDDTGEDLLVTQSVPHEFRLEGFRFSLKATLREDMASICMFGRTVSFDWIVPLTGDISELDLSVSGTGTIYNSACIINSTDHGEEWGILSDVTGLGMEYLLVPGLEPAFQQEGLDVNFEGAFRNDVDPFCHKGRIINTTLIEPI